VTNRLAYSGKATSGAKSDIVFLLGDPDFLWRWRNFAPILLSFQDLMRDRQQMWRLLQKVLTLIQSASLIIHCTTFRQNLHLPTLNYRWLRGDMIEVFKIIHNIYDAKVSPQLIVNERQTLETITINFLAMLFITLFFCSYCKYMEQLAEFCYWSFLCKCI